MPLDVRRLTTDDVARMMDFAVLNREYGWERYAAGCELARKYRFAAYHVLPAWVKPVVNEIGDFAREHAIEIGAPVSFPYGASHSLLKLKEAELLIEQGATALDMVANIGWLKDGRHEDYARECRDHVRLCHEAGIGAKIIIAVGYLTGEEIRTATRMVIDAGADFVKTATGTGPPGRPTFDDVHAIMDTIRSAGAKTRIKVSGIVEPKVLNAYAFISMGAHRIGTRDAARVVDSLAEIQETVYHAE
ncbi:MAG: deoxyribose-phosphate aldolase [Chitinivibrionales bacterium]|nr:deoxyribose-phosphate aldolase [Chitinivibrionales bacterium]MBD3394224.1 deoxyribose-phosphate aldolase [Chitinivibrionales bacterium]